MPRLEAEHVGAGQPREHRKNEGAPLARSRELFPHVDHDMTSQARGNPPREAEA